MFLKISVCNKSGTPQDGSPRVGRQEGLQTALVPNRRRGKTIPKRHDLRGKEIRLHILGKEQEVRGAGGRPRLPLLPGYCH